MIEFSAMKFSQKILLKQEFYMYDMKYEYIATRSLESPCVLLYW